MVTTLASTPGTSTLHSLVVTTNVSRYHLMASRGQSPQRSHDPCSREESPLGSGPIHPSCSVSVGRCWSGPSELTAHIQGGACWGTKGSQHTPKDTARQKPQGTTRAGRSHDEGGAPQGREEGQAVTMGCSEVSLHTLLQLLEFLDKLLGLFVGAAFQHPQCRPHCRWIRGWA